MHAFHIHQIHFLFLVQNGQAFPSPELRDTVTPAVVERKQGPIRRSLCAWISANRNIAGKFVYHCHILDHEDAGMMAIIQVNPAQ